MSEVLELHAIFQEERKAWQTNVSKLTAQFAALTAQRDALLAACRAVEWREDWDGPRDCPSCGWMKVRGHGHAPNCQLAAAIATTEAKE